MSPLLQEFLATVYPEERFAITPYAPFESIILLYGKKGAGKSPLTWEMARCVATGEPFFGHPTTKGPVLYLDLDTPESLVQKRLRLLDCPPENFYIEFPGVRNILQSPAQAYFREQQAKYRPIFVVLNTLRKLYSGDEKDGALPSRIYATLQAIFSPAAILLVHHDKKSSGDPAHAGDPNEAFSGHMAWLNDAQVGLHLTGAGGTVPGLLRLHHSGSQVSAQLPPLTLQLHSNGTAIVDYLAQKAGAVIKLYHELPETMTKSERIHVITQQLGYSERSVWTYLSRLPDSVTATLQRDTPSALGGRVQ